MPLPRRDADVAVPASGGPAGRAGVQQPHGRAGVWHLLLGLVDLAAGVIALAWPGPTALVLVLIVGIWAITAGIVEIAAAFGKGFPGRT